ncbi:MAG: iron ABC transporter permease [Haliscomenobacter sp.]|nr:iron ABC transporter permease [Haliscomenobacter sp.]MBK8652892.1 iron ABC transporter permease [Haliscomenobacter sp.]
MGTPRTLDAWFTTGPFAQNRKVVWIILAAGLLCVSAFAALLIGAYKPGLWETLATIAAPQGFPPGDERTVLHTIIWEIRLPRILLAIGVGIALASSGAVYQGCFRNPLVEPYILGVSAGAAFGAALGIVFPKFFLSIQLMAFAGGAIAVFSAYALARRNGDTPVVALVLAGVLIGSIATALVSVLKYLANDAALREIVFWYMGGFYHVSWPDVRIVLPGVLAGFTLIWALSWKLNVLSMGDEEARALGVHPERYKVVLVALATFITALSVSACGIIAWIGLMMPHAARMLLGPDHRFVLPMSAIMGALYLIICDTLARTLIQAEIPVGIITSLLGAPYLLYLLRNKGKDLF